MPELVAGGAAARRRSRPLPLPVQDNPGAFDVVELAALGVAAFLAYRAVAGQFPDAVGGGNAGGIDPATGQPAVPASTVFRLGGVATGSFINAFYNGQAFEVPAFVSHRGPAGLYVVGLSFAYSGLVGSFLGVTHGDPFQTVERNLEVGADAVFVDYPTTFTGAFEGGCCSALDVRFYVRDTAGRVLADQWSDQSMWSL